VRTIERYVDAVEAGLPAEGGAEDLDAATREFERLELALRTTDGVPPAALPVAELEGLVEVDARGRAVLTVPGRLMASEVATRLRTG
jgi:oxygen-independent coproporphyrinogen-3 oxidase